MATTGYSLTHYAEGKVGDAILRGISFTAPAQMYMALFTVAPTDAGGGTEVSGGGYARQPVTFGAGTTQTTGTLYVNSATVTFPQATANWGTIVAFAFFDAATGGNMWEYTTQDGQGNPLNITVNAGTQLVFNAGQVSDIKD
jgi:hypothetical protein